MDPQEHSEEAIFLACIELPPGERAAFLESACAGDKQKRNSVESLIRAHETEDAFLDSIPDGPILEKKAWAARTARRDEKAGDSVGHYELIEILGEGAWGKVWKARQTEPIEREVALKILKVGLDTEEFLRRFHDEQRVLAKLNYPNIATILDAGATKRGRPYLVMELVRGKPLIEYANEKRLSIERRIETFIWVCKAVQYAHSKGVVHRDIKPSNVLVKEVQSEAIPKVIDFGIAKTVQAPVAERADGEPAQSFMGTPYYSSPEQLEGRYEDVDARSDIYSLGALLYELITGRRYLEIEDDPDLKGEAIRKLLADAMPTEPSSAYSKLSLEERETIAAGMSTARRELERRIKGELDWVVMKCLQRDPVRRYQSALELADDLQAFLEDRPVSASAPGFVYRTRKFVKRQRFAFGVAAAASLAFIASLLVPTADKSDGNDSTNGNSISNRPPVVPILRQVSFSGKAHSPKISPDGRYVAYVNHNSTDIIVTELATNDELIVNAASLLPNSPKIERIHINSWSPDSKELLVSLGKSEKPRTTIVSRSDGSVRSLGSYLGSRNFPFVVWSSNSDRVYASYQNIDSTGSVEVEVGPMSDLSPKFYEPQPEFANNHLIYVNSSLADGKLMIVTRDYLDTRNYSYWTMNLDTTNIQRVFDSADPIDSFSQSPSGKSTYFIQKYGEQTALSKFSTNDPSNTKALAVGQFSDFSLSRVGKGALIRGEPLSNLYYAEKDASGDWVETSITQDTRQIHRARLSPDGDRIAFTRSDGDYNNIFVMDIASKEINRLTSFRESGFGIPVPAWSPNGQEIAFGSSEAGDRRVWVMDADGSSQRPIRSTNISDSLYVSWAPDERILYQIPGNASHRFVDPKTGEQAPMFELDDLFYGDSPVKDPDNPTSGWNFEPHVSPGGSKIALHWDRRGGVGLWIVDKGENSPGPRQVAGMPMRSAMYQHIDAIPYRGKRVRLTFNAKANKVKRPVGYPIVRFRAFKTIPKGGIVDPVFYAHQVVKNKDWEKYFLEDELNDEAVTISVMVVIDPGVDFLLDDFRLAVGSGPDAWEPIELVNPSFEAGLLGGEPVGWSFARPNKSSAFEIIEKGVESGNRALRAGQEAPVAPRSGYWPLKWSSDGEILYYHHEGAIWMYSESDGSMKEYWRGPEGEDVSILYINPEGDKIIYSVWDGHSDVWTIENFDPEFNQPLAENSPKIDDKSKVEVSVASESPNPPVSNLYRVFPKSVAVLPFENLSPESEESFFADGVQEDILTNLARVKDLHVMSRTATLRYRDSEETVSAIGKELGVRYLVKGSVQRSKDRLNVSVSLFDCDNGRKLWASDYDVEIDDVFRIQAMVAKEVSAQLKVVLTPQEIYRIEERLTHNQKAYDYYVKYRQLVAQERGKIEEKAALLEKAVALDSEFAEAQARLAQVYIIWWDREDHRRNPELYSKAHHALEKARRLKPETASLSYAEAMFATYEHNDLVTAIDKLLEALELDRGFYTALRSIGRRCLRLGRLPEAQRYMEEVYLVDPTSQDTNFYLFLIYVVRGNWEKARNLIYRNSSGNSDRDGFWAYQLAILKYFQSGEKRDFANAVNAAGQLDAENSIRINILKALISRDYQQAAQLVDEIDSDDQFYLFYKQQFSVSPPRLLSALLWYQLDEEEKYLRDAREARNYLEKLIETDPNADPEFYSDLAVCYALEGNKEVVNRLIDETRARTQERIWNYEFGMHCEITLAIAYMILGDHDKAIETLEAASEMDGPVFLNRELDLWFIFDRLRGDPRFDALLEE